MRFTESSQQVIIFTVFSHKNRAQMCVSKPGLSPQREEWFFFQSQSQSQRQVLEVCVKCRRLGPLLSFPILCTLMIPLGPFVRVTPAGSL